LIYGLILSEKGSILRVLVTGSSGFLGGRISEYFLDKGHCVILGSSKKKPFKHNFKGVRFVHTDWDSLESLENICTNVDIIIHTVGMNAKDCEFDPIGALNVNAAFTASIVQAAIKKNVKHFLYLSTIHVYTDVLQGVITEENCTNNLHPYASSHRAAEDIVLSAQKYSALNAKVIRVSNGFGYPVYKDTNCWALLVNDLCKQAVENKKMVLSSDGSQYRNFISIVQICDIINHLVCSKLLDTNHGTIGVINVGSNETCTILEMAEKIQERSTCILGYKPELITGESTNKLKLEPLDYNTDKLISTGYQNNFNLNLEIDSLLEYCYSEFKNNNDV